MPRDYFYHNILYSFPTSNILLYFLILNLYEKYKLFIQYLIFKDVEILAKTCTRKYF